MGLIYERVNQALDINPPAGAEALTVHGSDWLWAVTAIFVVSSLVFFPLSYIARSGEKFFHYIFTIANLVGAIAYYAMASDLAWTVIATSNGTGGDTRQIFFAKYVFWVVSFPSAVVSLGVLSGVSWTTILYNVALSWTWVISYLVSAYTDTNYKWGFFAFGTAAWIFLAASTLGEGLQAAKRVGVSRDYAMLAGWVNLLWLLYPIAFGLSDGGNRIGVTAGFIFFGILDVLMIPVLSFAVLALSRKWDYGKLNIAFTQYGRVNTKAGTFPEKETAPAAGGVTGEQAA